VKKVFSFVILLSIITGFVLGINLGTSAFAATEKLVVYNWGDYIDDAVIDAFEAETGIEVTYSTYDTNEIMLTKIIREKAAIDLICPSDYAIQRLLEQDMLVKIDFSKISTADNVNSQILDKIDSVFTDLKINNESISMREYMFPYMWGTLGIMYNCEVIDPDVARAAGYGLLWNSINSDEVKGKVYMKDSVRDAYAAAVLYLKEEKKLPEKYESMSIEQLINTVDSELLELVEFAFKKQKTDKTVKDYEVDFAKQEMIEGKGTVNLAWSGDALWAMEESDILDYFVPEIGGNIWFDGWAIPKTAQNVDAAHKFIEFLARPDNAMKNAVSIGYTSAISEEAIRNYPQALDVLLENEYDIDEFFGNLIRYPAIDSTSFAVMRDFGDSEKDVIEMWERVKAEGMAVWMLIIIIVSSAIGVCLIIFVIYIISKKKKRHRIVE
jgi:spermidine/putrescine-binding protein